MPTKIHLSNEGCAPYIGGDSFTGGPALPADIGWCPCLGRLDNASGPSGYEPGQVYDALWARRIAGWCVKPDHKGLVLEDDESPQWADLRSFDRKKREAAIDLQRTQQNLLMKFIPGAIVGPYAQVTAGHKWPATTYARDGYSFGRVAEFTNRTEVIFALAYLIGADVDSGLYHYDALGEMADAARDEFGKPIAFVVNPTVWDGPNGALAAADTFVRLDSFRAVLARCMRFKPEHIVYWHNHIYFCGERAAKAKGAPLTTLEATQIKQGAIAEINEHLQITREEVAKAA